MGRRADRGDLADEVRIRMLEDDADHTDSSIDSLTKEIHHTARDMGTKVDALRQVLVGILVAVTTASILLAMNLVVHR
jgi:hypothetical protein